VALTADRQIGGDEMGMDGIRHVVSGADGVDIGLLSAGSGPPLLLVHGGAGQIEGWQPVWDQLSRNWRVTAMDRRGRGSSGDGQRYSIDAEYGDVAAVAGALGMEAGGPIDVFAHSYGATCALGATNHSAPFRRIALYEPPSSRTASPEFVDRLTAMIVENRTGQAMVTFLTEIIGLTGEEVDDLKNAPQTYDIMSVLSATLPREGRALQGVDVATLAGGVTSPTLFLLGERSPDWAQANTRETDGAIPDSRIVTLPGLGHEAIDQAPELVVDQLARFFGESTGP
jgi:pimeloyl-ACP methyl ester carboxylesterase